MKNSERGKKTDAMIDALQAKRRGAPPEYLYEKKLSTDELKKEAYEQYCAHIASGRSKRSWVFKHPELTLTWESMENYIKDENSFDPAKKRVAESEGFGTWEEIIADSAKGKNTKANVASLQMVMRNKYGWDKNNPNTHDDNTAAAESAKMLDKLAQHIKTVHVNTSQANAIGVDIQLRPQVYVEPISQTQNDVTETQSDDHTQ